ncbi:MAG: hypothetical protein M0Q23_01385 [Syntrophales bacterium]|nr:hypothetical protein [Syntrophales bacterium]MCK9527300.1 hypothetical protein [Syntrophales bacterium]MDX9921230.1 hypothetical protein [Syntrophales bacterium]
MKRQSSIFLAGLFLILCFVVPASQASGNESPEELLQRGIREYRMDYYEEAIETLTAVREFLPQSSLAAFMLGMAYKQIMDYQKALPHFQDAVTLEPRIREALPELINTHYRLGNLEEAHRWIALAEKEDVLPATVSFLKGLVLQKEGKHPESVEAFERAKKLDPKITQSADFQIGLSYMMARKFREAGERFQAAVVADPATDLGTYARRYQDLVDQRVFLERPWRFTLGLFGRMDSNVISKPEDSAIAGGITNESSLAFTPSFRIDYVPVLEGRKLFNASYSLGTVFLDKNASTHNMIGNIVSLNPGYRFERSALNFNVSYGHYMLGGRRYVEMLSAGPLYRYLLNNTNIIEVFAGYAVNNYFQPVVPPDIENDRDSEGIRAYVSWVWLFARDSFFNARYEFTDENADGLRYDNRGHRFSLNTIFPIADDVKIQASIGYFLRDFSYTLPYPEPLGGGFILLDKKRKDNQYSLSLGLTWEVTRQLNAIVSYSGLRNRSNDVLNTYTRHVVTTGIEYKF